MIAAGRALQHWDGVFHCSADPRVRFCDSSVFSYGGTFDRGSSVQRRAFPPVLELTCRSYRGAAEAAGGKHL